MVLILAIVGARRRPGAALTLLDSYVAQANRLAKTELAYLPHEPALATLCQAASGRTGAILMLADSAGELLSSTGFAEEISSHRDTGVQRLILAIGPANGWSSAFRASATKTLSFGRMTLPHELAAVVAAEQIYRALTILAGHPYHLGH